MKIAKIAVILLVGASICPYQSPAASQQAAAAGNAELLYPVQKIAALPFKSFWDREPHQGYTAPPPWLEMALWSAVTGGLDEVQQLETWTFLLPVFANTDGRSLQERLAPDLIPVSDFDCDDPELDDFGESRRYARDSLGVDLVLVGNVLPSQEVYSVAMAIYDVEDPHPHACTVVEARLEVLHQSVLDGLLVPWNRKS